MTKNISIIDPQEVPEITKKVSGAKLSQVAQAVNIVISETPKAPLIEFAQLQKKSKLRELVDIAERARKFGSLKRALSPEDYEIAMAEAAKQVKPFKKMRGAKGPTHDENGNPYYGIDPNN